MSKTNTIWLHLFVKYKKQSKTKNWTHKIDWWLPDVGGDGGNGPREGGKMGEGGQKLQASSYILPRKRRQTWRYNVLGI